MSFLTFSHCSDDAKVHLVQGKLIVRFDDTNPSKEKLEFEESMIKDEKGLEGTIKSSILNMSEK